MNWKTRCTTKRVNKKLSMNNLNALNGICIIWFIVNYVVKNYSEKHVHVYCIIDRNIPPLYLDKLANPDNLIVCFHVWTPTKLARMTHCLLVRVPLQVEEITLLEGTCTNDTRARQQTLKP